MRIRKTVLALLAAVGVASGSPVLAMADTTNTSVGLPNFPFAQHRKLVALGDSITFGYNLGPNNSHPSRKAFPYLIGKWNDDSVQDLGVPASTSADLLTAVNQNAKYQSLVRKANVVTIDIGSNDLLGLAVKDGLLNSPNPTLTSAEEQQFTAAIQQFSTNLPQIVSAVHNLAPHAYIVLYNLYDPFSAQQAPALHTMAEALIGEENQVIATVAAQAHLTVADAYDAFNGRQSVLVRPFDVHPTVLGQDVLAAVGERALGTEEIQSFQAALSSMNPFTVGESLLNLIH